MDDLARDRFSQPFDSRGFGIAPEDVEGCLFEDLSKARHVHAGLVGREVGNHCELRVVHLRASVDFQMDDPAHAGNACAIERESYFRLFRLTVGVEAQSALQAAYSAVHRSRYEMWCNLRERGNVVRSRLEVRLHDDAVDRKQIDVDGTRREPPGTPRAPDCKLDVAREVLECGRVQVAAQRRSNVQVRRPFPAVGRLGFVKRGYGNDLRARAQALQRGQDVSLPIPEIRSDSDMEVVHAGTSSPAAYRSLAMQRGDVYPYVLDPKLTTQVWGGDELVRIYGKHGDPNARLGESWECWDDDRVINGARAGSKVADLRASLGAELLGDLDPTKIFPVLTKIITAHDWLSVQVHPDDAYAQRVEHQPFGKTECWYVLDAQPDAQIVYGWTRDTSRAEYERRVADGTLGELLRKITLKTGDTVYIPHGLVHAIGPGITIFETQQASDLTYRMFDYNRVGLDGKPRELHVRKAADVLNYRATTGGTLIQLTYHFEGLDRTALIADEHFVVERIVARSEPATMATNARPLILMSLDAPIEIRTGDSGIALDRYQTVLLAAASQWCTVRAANGDAAPFMFVTPPENRELLPVRLLAAGITQEEIDRFIAQFRPRQ